MYLIDTAFEGLTGSSMDDLESKDGESISIGSVMKEGLEKILSNLTYAILFPQKVCPGVGDDIPTRGSDAVRPMTLLQSQTLCYEL